MKMAAIRINRETAERMQCFDGIDIVGEVAIVK